jgi:hypothetical protein
MNFSTVEKGERNKIPMHMFAPEQRKSPFAKKKGRLIKRMEKFEQV